nr:ABC transporter permease/substrate-binding protein [Bacillus testis]
MDEFLDVFAERQGQLGSALLQHIQLSFISLLIAVIIAIPLGIYLTKKPRIAEGIIGITAVLQTIPSLALLGLLIPLFGIGKVPAIIALVVYALLPILRNTYTGIKEVDPSLIEAARAMGMNNTKRMMKVELPLAMPVIMAGIRTGMVLIVGTATLAALIGAGGLGEIILLGIDRNDTALIILGAIPTALLAILIDFILRRFEKLSFKTALASIAALVVVVALAIGIPYLSKGTDDKIVIAGKLGSEPEILINLYKELIEADTDYSVELKPGLGKTSFVFNALKSGSIDIYPEFTGTAITEFLKENATSTDAKDVYNQARAGLKKTFNMELLKPMEYNNTYAIGVSKTVAEQYGLEKLSDLKAYENQLKAGFTLEFSDREDGYKGIKKKYGIEFAHLKTMEPKLRYRAVKIGDIDIVDAYSTDSELRQYKLKVLKDDLHLFPPYQGAPLLKEETLEKYPDLKKALNKLSGKITDDEMRQMNYEVNVNGKSPAEVAKAYLQKEKLIK